jgi:excisionase family DNA binding protein
MCAHSYSQCKCVVILRRKWYHLDQGRTSRTRVEEAVDSIKNEFVFVKPVRAAKLLDMSKSKIYEMIQRNEIPSVRLGGCLRIPMSALDDLVARARGEER